MKTYHIYINIFDLCLHDYYYDSTMSVWNDKKDKAAYPYVKFDLAWIETLWKRKYGLDLFSLSLCPMKINFLGGESMSIYFRLVKYPSYIFFNSFVFRYKLGNRRPIFDTICDWNG